ncbi:MAG: hypothetical protein NC203_06415 [Firmicutes bacterium]|nr:hypothetical protein [[Eubacterium] siraeum]MCM1487980.1 hypothetical protein [Bacillota bacterium]
MNSKDLFNAINDIDLKYVEKAWGSTAEEYAEAKAITIQPARKSAGRIFGGAAACVGVIGAAAAAVIAACGVGDIKTLLPAASAYDGGADITEASGENTSEATGEIYGNTASYNTDANWELLRRNNEERGVIAESPTEAVKKELEAFKDTCISYELKEICEDNRSSSLQMTVKNIEEDYGVSDPERIAFITAKIDAKLDKEIYGLEYMSERNYCFIRDDDGTWYMFSVGGDTDAAALEEHSAIWQRLKEEQGDTASADILTALQNYITVSYGNAEGFAIDRIKHIEGSAPVYNSPLDENKALYGLETDGQVFYNCGVKPAEILYHYKSEGEIRYCLNVCDMAKSSEGRWYLLQTHSSEAWTQKEEWDKLKENTLLPSKDMLETVNKQLEEYLNGDDVVYCTLRDISVNEKLSEKEREVCADIYLYHFGLEDPDRIKVVTADFSAVLDPEKDPEGRDSSDGMAYMLIQADDGSWYIKGSCDIRYYPEA